MSTIKIIDFADEPGARLYSDGPKSGEEFFDTVLKPMYVISISKGEKLTVIFDGTEGVPSSFINEAFRRLGGEFGADKTWDNLEIISIEMPRYIAKVKDALYEKKG